MSEKRGLFVAYYPCGKCASGAYIDDPAIQASIGEFLTTAVRDGHIAKFYPPGPNGPPPAKLAWHGCQCSSVTVATE